MPKTRSAHALEERMSSTRNENQYIDESEEETIMEQENAKRDLTAANNYDLNAKMQQLMQLLTLKVEVDEQRENQVKITANNFEKVVNDFDGVSIPVVKWFEIFEHNAEAYGLNEKQKYVQARGRMCGTAKLFLESEYINNYNELKHKLTDEFRCSWNSADIHQQLKDRKKKKTESFHEYMLNMKKVASMGEVEETAVIRHIVNGLQIKSEFKFAMYRCKTYKQLKEEYETYELVHRNDNYPINDNHQRNENNQKNENNNQRNQNKIDAEKPKKKEYCFNCGSSEHKRKECTSATKCFRCNEEGHISRSCPSNADRVRVISNSHRLKTILLNGLQVECLVDTGSDVTIVKQNIADKLNVDIFKTASTLRGLGNTSTKPIGYFNAEVEIDTLRTKQKFLVVSNCKMDCNAILGYDFIRKFEFIADSNGFLFQRVLNDHSSTDEYAMEVYSVFEEYNNITAPKNYQKEVEDMIEDAFQLQEADHAQCPIILNIVPDGNIVPFRQAPSRLSPNEAEAVKNQVNEWLQMGIVRESFSNVASRVVVVKKKDQTLRVCVDYRKLNSMVLQDLFPVPLIEDVLDKLQAAKFFTIMDLENGFFHVPIEEKSRHLTAFITREGLFEFNRAPFGFKNSPAAFIRYVNHVFQKLINEEVMQLYMDDIVIFAESADVCMQKSRQVLETAARYGLRIKWKKCSFLQQSINFLGHTVANGRVWPGADKTSAVKRFAYPKDIKGVQSFLGLTGFFRKFIPRYAEIARPLTNLLRKNAVFIIGEAEKDSIERLKDILTSEPVLHIYSREAKTELHTDASKNGLGAVLLQCFEGHMHPVYFWSKKTSEAEAKKHSYILEIKAAYLALKKFRHFLLGTRFKLVTDCAAFKQTTSKDEIPRDVEEWVLYIKSFTPDMEHRAGARMKHVDHLSRYPQDVLIITTELSARLRKAQQEDDNVKAVLQLLQNGPYENFKMKGGLLFKEVDGCELLVVPKIMERDVIKNAHDSGHFAARKTMHNIKQQYFISHLEGKVSKYISNCIVCIIHSKKLGKQEGRLHCIGKGDVPLQTLHVDHLGPMDMTSKMYKYIFAVVDGFSKFVWLYPVKSTGQDEVVKKLKEWASVFGFPARILSDRGSAFTSNAYKEFLEVNMVEQICTTTGVARGNGQVERVNRCIIDILAKLSSDEPAKWYKYVPRVQMAINSHVHSTTLSTPFEIMFGTKMCTKVDDRLLDMMQQELVEKFNEERQQLRIEAKHNIEEAQKNYKMHYDKKRRTEQIYKLGDLVAIKRTQFVAGRKLASEYLGPYAVIKVKRNGRYDVKKASINTEGPNITATSCDNMKLWKYVAENEDILSSGTDEEDQEGRM